MFSFLHLSDLHLPPSETDTRHGIYPCRKLKDVFNSIDELEYTPSFAIITGDLSQGGTVQGYELVKSYTERLEEKGIRTMLAVGNGDDRENYRRVFRTPSSSGPIHYSEDHEHLRVIVLDSLQTGSRGGRLEGGQLEWLSDVLRSDPERPTIIALHHPINPSSLALFDGWLFDGSQIGEFYEAVSGGNVLAVLNGHLHHNQVTTVNGVPHVQAGSTVAELSYNEEEYWTRNTSSYNQVIHRDGMLFVRTITLPYDGRVLMKEPIKNLFG
jgi:3',5'-cyclic AMP phosphodiesterase CpdA